MQQIRPDVSDTSPHGNVEDAAALPPVDADEAAMLATVELERLLSLLHSLAPADWERATYCTRWNVRQVVAHVAGALAAYAEWDRLLARALPWTRGKADEPGYAMADFLADLMGIPEERWQEYHQAGFTSLDALNQFQVDERARATPAQLCAELRGVGPTAIDNRRQLPQWMRSLQLPVSSGTRAPVAHLLDIIYPRDMWMHRMEIALAAARPVVRRSEHEGRLTALVMRDLSRRLTPLLGERSVVYRLTGPDGGNYRFGPDTTPAATLAMDTVDFHLLASERVSPQQAQACSLVTIEGDATLGEYMLGHTIVLY